jgi:dipeptide transport system ATP-binding protein
MYAGQIMEERSAQNIFEHPQHPYTDALLAAMPERSDGMARLATIPGMVPGLFDRPSGCLFAPRCKYANAHCREQRPALRDWQAGMVRCHTPLATEPAMEGVAA